MSLEKKLRDCNYDLLEGPLRNHRELQLWLDTAADRPDLEKNNIGQSFRSDLSLTSISSPALNVNSNDTQKYDFNVGLSALDSLLKGLKLGKAGLSAIIKKGVSVQIAYDKSTCVEYGAGDLRSYFSDATLLDSSHAFLRHLNANNFLVISGVLYAENFEATIETDSEITADVAAEIAKVVDAKVDVKKESNSKIVLSGEGLERIPIAVKAHKLRYRNDKFIDLELITDRRSRFN